MGNQIGVYLAKPSPRGLWTLSTLHRAPIASACEECRLSSPFTTSMPSIPSMIRSDRSRRAPSTRLQEIPTPAPAPDPPLPSDLNGLWSVAFEEYRQSLKGNLRDQSAALIRDMKHCTTCDDILSVLRGTSKHLRASRRGGRKSQALRDTMAPIVRGLSVILDTASETGSAVVRFTGSESCVFIDCHDIGGTGR